MNIDKADFYNNNEKNNSEEEEGDERNIEEMKKLEAVEKRAIVNLIHHYRVSEYLDFTKEFFKQSLQTIATAKSSDNKFLMDKYLPINILKMFNGLEIHNLNKAFSKFRNEITLEMFLIIGLRILDIPKDDSPYVFLGMMNLYYSLTAQRGKKTLNFRDFLNNFIRVQSMFSEHKGYVNEENRTMRFAISYLQDNSHHESPIKNAHYSKILKIFFCLDEGANHIRVYSSNGEFKKNIKLDEKKHGKRSIMIIMDCGWSESKKKLAVCSQDLTVSFFSHEENFLKEDCYFTTTLHTDVWYVEFCDLWFTTDTLYSLYYWDSQCQQNKVYTKFGSKISHVIEMATLGLIGIASFDKKVVFYNPQKNVVALTINIDSCSAHTLKFSKEYSLLFAATFGHVFKVYQVDKARDYTQVAKLETPATTTAIEIFEDYNMIVTCDDEGNLKSWDYRTFKSLQHYMLHSNCPVSKIIHVEGTKKFCVVTNRLNFFDFGQVVVNSEKNHQLVPSIQYIPEKEEIVVGLSGDIRVFSLRYGILSEIYDKELYNIDDGKKLVYFKKGTQSNNIFYVDYRGFVRQLMFSTNTKANAGFQPFKIDNANFIYDEACSLLVTWHKNNLLIYRYEISTHTHILLRSISLPEPYHFTLVKVYKSRQILVTVLNHSLMLVWGFHKLEVCGAFINCDKSIKLELDDPVLTADTRTPKRSPFHFASANRESGGFSSPRHNESNLSRPLQKRKPLPEETRPSLRLKNLEAQKVTNTESENKLLSQQTQENEILTILFVENYNCFLMIDGQYNLYLVEQDGFQSFGTKVHIKIPVTTTSTDYSYVEAKIKAIDFKPLLENKSIDLTEIGHLYQELTPNCKDKDMQYLLFLCDSENQIIVFNLNPVLSKHFKPSLGDAKEKQPFHTCVIEYTETNIQYFTDKANSNNKSNLSKFTFDLPSENISIWRAGRDGPIVAMRPAAFNTIVILTLNQNAFLKVWNIQGKLLGSLNVKDTKSTIWNINQYNTQQRVEAFQKTKQVFQEIYTKYEKDIENGLKNALDAKFSQKVKSEFLLQEAQSLLQLKDSPKKRTTTQPKSKVIKEKVEPKEFKDDEATIKAQYVLDRDKNLYLRKNANEDDDSVQVLMKRLETIQNVSHKLHTIKAGLASSVNYIQSLSKKLGDVATLPNGDAFDDPVRLRKKASLLKKYKSAKTNPLKLEASTARDLPELDKKINLHSPKDSLPSSHKSEARKPLYTDVDYLDIYNQVKNQELTPKQPIDFDALQPKSEMQKALPRRNAPIRTAQRSNLLKDLDSNMKKVKNLSSNTNVKKNLIKISQYLREDDHLENKHRSQIEKEPGMNSSTLSPYPSVRLPNINTGQLVNTSMDARFQDPKEKLSFMAESKIRKKANLANSLEYDPQLDREIIEKMNALDKLNRKAGSKVTDIIKKKPYLEVASEIDSIKNSRGKSLQSHYSMSGNL